MGGWRFWPIWLSSEAAERIEDKIDELRREARNLQQTIEEFRALMCERDRIVVSLLDEHDAMSKFGGDCADGQEANRALQPLRLTREESLSPIAQ